MAWTRRIVYISTILAASSTSTSDSAKGLAATEPAASGKLKTVLGIDDACHRAAEAASDGLPAACALGAVQHSARAKLAAPPLTKSVVNQSRSGSDAQDMPQALLAQVSASSASGQPVDENATVGAAALPGPQFPKRGTHPHGWKVSQERWIAQGDTLPEWAGMPEVDLTGTIIHERSSVFAPVGAGCLLVFCIILVVILKTLMDRKFDKSQAKEEPPARSSDEAGAASLLQSAADSRLPNAEKAEDEGQSLSLRRLYRYATRWDYTCMTVAMLMAVVHGATMPLAFYNMDNIFQCLYLPNDDGSIPPMPGPHTERDAKVWHVVRVYLFVGVTIGVARASSVLLMSRTSKRQGRMVRTKVFEKMLRQTVEWHEEHDPGEMSSTVSSDSFLYQRGMAESVLELLRGCTLTISGLSLAAYKDWRVTIVMLIAMPASAIAVAVSISCFEKAGSWQLKLYSKAGGVAENAMMLIKTVHAFCGHSRELKNYEDNLKEAQSEGTKLGLVSGFCFGVNQAVVSFALCLGIYFGSGWIIQGWEADCWKSEPPFGTCKTGGSMMACIYTVMWGFVMGMGTMNLASEAIAKAKAAAARLFAIIDAPIKTSSGGKILAQVEGHVAFDNVRFWYRGREAHPALAGASLRIPAGTTCAFVGHSGSGKSTMVNLLLRFYKPQSGSILLDGQDIQGLNLESLRMTMSLVEQEPVLFGMSIFENITFGCKHKVGLDEVQRAAELANAHSFISTLPDKYHTQVGQRGTQVSGGQKQRIAIARALVRNPTILLLDEATSALDTASERLVQEALDRLMHSKRRTTLVIAHRLSTVRDADKIAVFQDGSIIEEGTHTDLLAQHGAYAKLVRTQVDASGEADSDSDVDNLQPFEATPDAANTLEEPDRSISPSTKLLNPPRQIVEVPAKPVEKDAEKEKEEEPHSDVTRRMWEESRPEFYLYAIGVFAMSIGATIVPWYMMHFAQTLNLFNRPPAALDPDTGVWSADFDEGEVTHAVTVLCFFLQVCGVLVIVVNCISFYCFNAAAEAVMTRLRQKAFKMILRQDIAWHDENPPGILTSQLAEQIPKIKLLVGNGLATGTQGFMGAIMGLTIAMIFSWRYTLCVLGVLPFLALGTCLIIWAHRYENEALFGGLVSETLTSIKTVAAYGMETRLMGHFNGHLDKQAVGEHFSSFLYGMGNGIVVGGIFILLGFDLMFANIFINKSIMAQDRALVVFFAIFAASMGAVQGSAWLGDRSMAIKAAGNIFKLLDKEPAIDNMGEGGQKTQQANQVGCRIEFQDVHFLYATRPDIKVFQGLSLVLEANTTTALVGPSGSGKSTTVSLLQRFYDVDSGVIRLNGVDIRELNLKFLRSQMGLVQQEPVLCAGTIIENIRYGNETASDEQIINAARAANAHAFICKLPSQYLTEVGNKGQALSGGQKQRIAIARALVRDPSLLLLDEATAALDAVSEKQVQEALDELLEKQHRTTLIIAHRLSTIQGADQICVMHHGKVVQKGTHQELVSDRAGMYAKLVGRQKLKTTDVDPVKALK